jgi:RNA polymerase sigma factor (sigma-70 family)
MKSLESKIFLEYNYLVNPIARKFALRNQMPYEDLIQVGNIGLVKAIRSFDSQQGEMKPFARRCIEREIFHYVRDRKRLIKISRSLKDLYFAGIKLKESGAADKVVAFKLGVTAERWREAVDAMSMPVINLETVYCPIETNNFNDCVSVQPPSKLSAEELQLARMFWIENLSLKDIKYEASKMGFCGNKVKTVLQQIALKANFAFQ